MADYEGLTYVLDDGRQVRIIRPHPAENQGKEYWAEMLDRSRKWPVSDEVIFTWFPDETISIAEAIELEEKVYADLQSRKQAARQAEADYWKPITDDDEEPVAPAPPALTLDEAAAQIESAFSVEWEGWPDDFEPYVSKWYPVDHTHLYIFDDPHDTKGSMRDVYRERNGDVEMVKGSELNRGYDIMPGL